MEVKTVQLDPECVIALIRGADHQSTALIDLYRLIYPNWNEIEKIDGWPAINKKTWITISEHFVVADKKNHPEVVAGGLWMNNGFTQDDSLDDWIVAPAPYTLKAAGQACT